MLYVKEHVNERLEQNVSFCNFDSNMIVESINDPKLLFAELERTIDPEYRFRIMYRLSYLLLNRAPKRSLQMSEALETLAKEISTPKAMGMALTAKARYYQRTGDYDQAMQLYTSAIEKLGGEDAYVEKAKALDGMGMVHSYIGQPKQAIARSEEAIKYFDMANDPIGMKANCMNNIGNAYGRIGDITMSIKYYQKALEVAAEYQQEKNTTHIRANMALQMNLMGRSEEAIVEFRQCYDEFKAKGSKVAMAVVMQNMALCHSSLGEYSDAVELFMRSMIDLKQLDYQDALADGHKGLAIVYLAMKGYHEATSELLDALAIYTKLGYVNGVVECLDLLGRSYMSQGKPDMAKDMWQRALKTAQDKGLTGFEKDLKDKLAKLD